MISPVALGASSEECDTNDDGAVNFGDISVFFGRFGATLGTPGYLAGLDLAGPEGPPDQTIDFVDLMTVFGCIG